MPSIQFENTYIHLPDRFFSKVRPAQVPAPVLIKLNTSLANDLGIDPAWLQSPDGISTLSGNQVPEGAEPIAQVYAGHQFAGWVPQLGDGRAILLGEVRDTRGTLRDLQWKGSGQTPYSRRG